jgi:FixJ family two-component response regulator
MRPIPKYDGRSRVTGAILALIRFAGWQPETFASAQEFLDRPRLPVPSCLVLDISLPDLNGLDLQKRIVDRTDMPIIFITGHGDEGRSRGVPDEAVRG